MRLVLPDVLRTALAATGPLDEELVRIAVDRWHRARRAVNVLPFGEPARRLAARIAQVARAERAAGVKVRNL